MKKILLLLYIPLITMGQFSVGNDQVEGKDWYVEFICPGTHQAGIRFYNSRGLKSVITILERNKI